MNILRAIIHEFSILIKLSRLNNPIPILMLFYPCCFTLFLVPAQEANSIVQKRADTLITCLLGSIIARTIGCIINDIVDRDIDGMVARTKNRPLANKLLKIESALAALLLLIICALMLLSQLSYTALVLCIIGAIMTVIYPFMKRITYFPQLFLGMTYNIGALVSYANIMNDINWTSILMYLGCISWTTAYDTIYAFPDTVDDKKLQIKSLALLIKEKWYVKYVLGLSYTIFISLFVMSVILSQNNASKLPFLFAIYTLLAIITLAWQIITLNIHDYQNCLIRFRSNAITGILLCMAVLQI